MMFKVWVRTLVLLSSILSGLALATPVNLVANGSFENGGFASWVVGGNNTGFPQAVVNTNAPCCFGEFVPADPLLVGSPDAGGTHAVYFVDDFATQTLTQTVFLAAGSYEIGFDASAPNNGFANRGDAHFNATIAGVQLANYTVHGANNPGVWVNFSGLANVLTSGNYQVAFSFSTFGGASADVLIDRVFIAESSQPGGTPIGPGVPEPASLALVGAALLAAALAGRGRRASA